MEENKEKLIEAEQNYEELTGQNRESAQSEFGDKPISSRIKSVIQWSKEQGKFVIEPVEREKIKHHFQQDEERFAQFELALHSLAEHDHPSKRQVNCCLHFLYWCLAIILMIALGYLFLIILQLALFNLIMLVVMIVWWVRIFKVSRAMIDRCIVGAKTKEYRSFIKKLKECEPIQNTNIEIQEDDKGGWIAVHLPDTAEDDSDEFSDEDDNNEHEKSH